MFDVAVTDDVVAYAKAVLAKHDFGRRGVADGTPDQQLTGLVGEIVVQGLFGYPRTNGSNGPDGGVDLVFHGLTIDVKTIGRRCRPLRHYANNFSAHQAHFPTKVLLFCSLDWKRLVLTVCGWTFKDLFFRLAERMPAGNLRFRADGTSFPLKAHHYEIRNSDLYQAISIPDLREQLTSIAISEGTCMCNDCYFAQTRQSRDSCSSPPKPERKMPQNSGLTGGQISINMQHQ